LSHRDILGSVMGLGIKRDQIGDIILTADGYVLFTKAPADRLILNELKRVGREAVRVQAIDLDDVGEPICNYQTITGTVKSLRLDSVVSLCVGCSREKGKQLIENERVSVNAAMKASPSFSVPESCVISIRGCGKFHVSFNGTISAKGRYFITANKYL
jgi:RNA-binding protein YlmH